MRGRCIFVAGALWMIGAVNPNHALALNENTHEVINEQAVRRSQLDTILKTDVGLKGGIEEAVGDRAVFRWLRDGGSHEDDGDFLKGTARYLRHFHDPLQPWESAGLLFVKRYESSIRWMQRRDQDAQAPGTGNWGWPTARDLFYAALTSPASVEREANFAKTFRALGQLMHLITDASVPEHVRSDIHPLESLFRKVGARGFGSYEYWVSDRHEYASSEGEFVKNYLSRSIKPDAAIFRGGTGDSVARVEVARLIDANRYTGTDPNVTLAGAVGLAEFANANFFSEDTATRRSSLPNYPFPDVNRLVRAEVPDATGRVRAYFGKGEGDGLAAFPVAAECVLHRASVDAGISEDRVLCVDEEVWKEVAAEMLPRAMGYSAALLDYFFRGRLATTLRVYKEAGELHAELTIKNQTPDEDMTGRFELYYDLPDGTRRQLKVWDDMFLGQAESLTAESETLVISPLPTDTPPTAWTLVFKGRLGAEEGAVAASRVGGRYVGAVIAYTTSLREGETTSVFLDASAYSPEPTDLLALDVITLIAWGWPAGVTGGVPHGPGIQAVKDRPKESFVYYRDPTSGRSRVQIVGSSALCAEYTQVNYPWFYRELSWSAYSPTSPASAALVAFDPPETLAELYAYGGIPPVQRILHSTIGPGTTTDPIDLTDVRMLGLVLTTAPTDPPIPEIYPEAYPHAYVDSRCGVNVQLQFVD